MIKGTDKLIVIISFVAFFCCFVLGAQETDPFYLNLLEKGEQCFLDGDYKNAVKNLEIAYFGIHSNDEIKAKACIYLGLSHYYLRDSEKGTKYLGEAEAIDGLTLLLPLSIV